MSKNLDEFVKGLQNQIYEETRAEYGEVGFERWMNPKYMGAIENPNGYGRITGPCGDTMTIYLSLEKDRVKEAKFQTDGCGASMVCGSFAAELSLGKKADEVLDITDETILDVLGGLPEEDKHCALLAANTLKAAISDYKSRLK